MSRAYYNEFDRKAAAWLRELIRDGHIAPGDVDDRSIADVVASDLDGYTQCHFFAGIGGWSLALRLAGWSDGRPVWTGSCPCQPFSAAGQRLGHADARHLWPEFYRLIAECHPPVVLGEQVASALGRDWLAAVRADLETLGYAVGAADIGAAGVGAPHIRQRLYWVADGGPLAGEMPTAVGTSGGGRPAGSDGPHAPGGVHTGRVEPRGGQPEQSAAGSESARGLADGDGSRCGPLGGVEYPAGRGRQGRGEGEPGRLAGVPRTGHSEAGGLADTDGGESGDGGLQPGGEHRFQPQDGGAGGGVADALGERGCSGESGGQDAGDAGLPGEAGFWDDLTWLPCRDGKARPTQPGLFPLAHGIPGRVGLLRGAGNAIVPQVAQAFIEAYCGVREDA